MPMKETEMITAIFGELTKELMDPKNPPKDAPDGIQRLANGIGRAVVDYLLAHAEVHVTVAEFGKDAKGTLQ